MLSLLLLVSGACSSQASSAEGQTSKDVAASPTPLPARSLTPEVERESQFESSWFDNRHILVFGIVLLIIVIAAPVTAMYIQASRLRSRVGELEERHLKMSRASLRNSKSDHQVSTKNLEQRLSDLDGRLEETVHQIGRLTRDLLANKIAPESRLSSAPQPEESGLQFPESVEECLTRLRYSKILSVTSLGGHVIAAEKGELLLVMGDHPERPLLIIPRVARFITKQDYYNYFAEFYHCDKVTSGEVWIIEPAVANRIQGGWSLGEKGRLEIR